MSDEEARPRTRETMSHLWRRRKPLTIVIQQEEAVDEDIHSGIKTRRHLTLWDMVFVGVGGTIGTGVFVLLGFIANEITGPSVWLSFAISGFAALLSGLCYAELAGHIPASGSIYIYAYVYIGELAAIIGSACLFLEYAVSGAGVASSWGAMVVEMLQSAGMGDNAFLDSPYFNFFAFLVASGSTALLMYGVHESKKATNFLAVIKIGLVCFMTLAGLILLDRENFRPFTPFGTSGILEGATLSFFAYVGYDQVCCIAGEAIHPLRDVPYAVMYTLAIDAVLYILASVALVGMVPFFDISTTAGFPRAFADVGVQWASDIAWVGQTVTLPLVVLISIMAQPRLNSALAQDGLLPEIFRRYDSHGNLWWGCLIAGTIVTAMATFIPFEVLDALTSGGVLTALSLADTCVLFVRYESPERRPRLLENTLWGYHILSIVTSIFIRSVWGLGLAGKVFTVLFVVATAAVGVIIPLFCQKRRSTVPTFTPTMMHESDDFTPFRAPLVPLVPLLGIFVNWYLLAQLKINSILAFIGYMVAVLVAYFLFLTMKTDQRRGWTVSNEQGGTRPEEEGVRLGGTAPDVEEEIDGVMLREMSSRASDPLTPPAESAPQLS